MSTYSAAILAASGITSYWQLTETAGSSTAADSAGSSPLTATNVTFGAAGLVGTDTAASFNGTTSKLVKATSPIASMTTTTFEAWFKWTVGSTAEQCILKVGSTSNGIGLVINGNGTSTHHLYILAEGVAWHDTGFVLDGNPHHIVVTVASSGGLTTVYVDGGPVYSASFTYGAPSGGVSIGSEPDGSRPFQGVVAHAAVYTAVLSPVAVLYHYNLGTGFVWPVFLSKPQVPKLQPSWLQSLKICLPFHEGAGSPRNLVTGATATVTGANGWSVGKHGPARDPGSSFSTSIYDTITHKAIDAALSWTGAMLLTFRSFNPLGSNLWSLAAGNAGMWLGVNTGSGNPYLFSAVAASRTIFQSGTPLLIDRDNLLAARYDKAAGTLSLFINGISVASTSISANTSDPQTTSDVFRSSANNLGPPDAQLHAFYAWDRALSDAEILALASDPFAPVRPVGPRAWLTAGTAIWQGKIVSINQAVVAAGYY